MGNTTRNTVRAGRVLIVVLVPVIGGLSSGVLQPQTPPERYFVDVAAERGVPVPDRVTRGGVWEDFDGDGFLDLALGNIFAANQMFRNDGTGHFVDVSAQVGISPDLAEDSYGTNVADYDNDGDPDIVFSNGGFNSYGVVRLYRNDLKTAGVFTEVGAAAGIAGEPATNHAATWLDYDNDGLLDLFVHKRGFPSALYHNLGNGTFEDVAPQAGVDVRFGANGACAGDFDNDGYEDLFLVDFPLAFPRADPDDHSRLFHNNGDGTFTDVTVAAGLFAPNRGAFTCAVDDFNQDGWLDLFLATFNVFGSSVQEPSRLYINTGQNRFVEVAAQANAAITSDIMGLQSGDLNNDGYPELFVGTCEPAVQNPDILLLNRTDPKTGVVAFEDVSVASGIREVPATRTHGMSFADFDDDGDVDVFIGMGGNMPTQCGCPVPGHPEVCPCPVTGQEEPNRLWLNTSPAATNWLTFRLRGIVSSRDAIGARIVIEAGARRFHKHVSGGNGFNTRNALEIVAGIGAQPDVGRVWIHWPSGIWQMVANPALATKHLWPETGLHGPKTAAPDQIVTLNPVGPAGMSYDVYMATSRRPSAHPAGEELLDSSRWLIGRGTLPESGLGQLSVSTSGAIPDRSYYLQARLCRPVGCYWSNVHEMLIR